MQRDVYRDFDAFARAVGDIDAVMMLQNPKRRIWSLDRVELAGVHVQTGRLGSGNIVEGQSWADGYLVYLPLSARCEYTANATSFGTPSFMVVEPSTEFCLSTRDEHDWCTILISY